MEKAPLQENSGRTLRPEIGRRGLDPVRRLTGELVPKKRNRDGMPLGACGELTLGDGSLGVLPAPVPHVHDPRRGE